MKTCVLFLMLMLLAACGDSYEAVDPEGWVGENGKDINLDGMADGLEATFRMVDASLQPKTVFKKGEQIVFELEFVNHDYATTEVQLDPAKADCDVTLGSDLFSVYREDGTFVGRPKRCAKGSDNVTYYNPQASAVRQYYLCPWSGELWLELSQTNTRSSSSSPSVLPPGRYYCQFTLEWNEKPGLPEAPKKKQTFRVNFVVQY